MQGVIKTGAVNTKRFLGGIADTTKEVLESAYTDGESWGWGVFSIAGALVVDLFATSVVNTDTVNQNLATKRSYKAKQIQIENEARPRFAEAQKELKLFTIQNPNSNIWVQTDLNDYPVSVTGPKDEVYTLQAGFAQKSDYPTVATEDREGANFLTMALKTPTARARELPNPQLKKEEPLFAVKAWNWAANKISEKTHMPKPASHTLLGVIGVASIPLQGVIGLGGFVLFWGSVWLTFQGIPMGVGMAAKKLFQGKKRPGTPLIDGLE